MNAEFERFCREMNKSCLALQEGPKEIVSGEEAFLAYAYIRQMRIADAGDVILFCAAMNLLNTYVKQDQDDIGYGFKGETDHLVGVLWNAPIADVKVDYQRDKGMSLLVVDIFGLQFSFHNIGITEELKKLDAQHVTENALKWDGVRKQMCASTLFGRARENMLRRSNETFRGKDLEKKIVKMLGNYREGKMTFSDLREAI